MNFEISSKISSKVYYENMKQNESLELYDWMGQNRKQSPKVAYHVINDWITLVRFLIHDYDWPNSAVESKRPCLAFPEHMIEPFTPDGVLVRAKANSPSAPLPRHLDIQNWAKVAILKSLEKILIVYWYYFLFCKMA